MKWVSKNIKLIFYTRNNHFYNSFYIATFYYSAISTKRHLENENKGDEIVDILIHLQQYIPTIEFKRSTKQF